MAQIDSIVLGMVMTNCYLLWNNHHVLIVDPATKSEKIKQLIDVRGGIVDGIYLTHGHFDHLLGIDAFKEAFGVDTYVAEEDLTQVKLVPDMMQMFLGMPPVPIPAIVNFVNDGDEFKIGDTVLKAISTPGHTKGGMCYLVENNLFSGDTLFQGSVGRCDLLEGDLKAIVKSIKEKLFTLPDDTRVYPGHGASTTVGYEKKYNEILNI